MDESILAWHAKTGIDDVEPAGKGNEKQVFWGPFPSLTIASCAALFLKHELDAL